MVYEFEHSDMRFTRGGLDEKIALDRYAVNTTKPDDFRVGDTVVFIDDEAKGTRRVGVITMRNYAEMNGKLAASHVRINVKDCAGNDFDVSLEHITKPLETTPQAMWARWAFGAALVELDHSGKKDFSDAASVAARYERDFSWLFDGYRYSPGGRIQLGLGHEYLGLPKANVTLVNCFVGPKPECGEIAVERGSAVIDPVDQWRKVLDNLRNQIEIQRRGGGYGINISDIATVRGVGPRFNAALSLPRTHKDFDELMRLAEHGKFDGIDVGDVDVRDGVYVDLVGDSIDGIMDSLMTMIRKAYAGHDVLDAFGALRARHAQVSNIGRSSGAASWMTLFALAVRLLRQESIDAVDFAELFAFTTNLVEQGGSRRGALMLVMNVDSPVIEKFVTRKRESGHLVGANVSVGVTDAFMRDVKMGAYQPHMPDSPIGNARRIWSLIIESTHASAEPGVLFLDTINNESNSWNYERLEASNPCGEQPLPKNGACNLGHLVLPRFIVGDWTKGNAVVDTVSLERAVRLGVRFQDDMIDASLYPTPATKAQQAKERRVGMGTMGLGTMLIMLGMRYGSDDANTFIDELYAKIAYWAYDESMNLAAEKGTFPAFKYEKYVQSGFMKRLLAKFPQLDEKLRKHGIRNVTLLTQAPTGTTGTKIDLIFAEAFGTGCTTGIEPAFSLAEYERAGRLGIELITPKIIETYRAANGLTKDSPLPDYFVDTQSLSPDDHVRVQATIQRWVDSAISKTANAPESFSVEDTARLYEQAYDLGCKGVTIYRANSREAQVLSTERGKAKIEAHIEADAMKSQLIPDDIVEELGRRVYDSDEPIFERSDDILRRIDEHTNAVSHLFEKDEPTSFTKRPSRVYGFTEKIRVPIGNERLGKVYVTIGLDDAGRPFEVFVNANDEEIVDIAASLGRMVTQMLRYGGTSDNVDQAVKHLRRGQANMFSLPSQLARLIEEVAYKGVEVPVNDGGTMTVTLPEVGEFSGRADVTFNPRITPDVVERAVQAVRAERRKTKLARCSECGEDAYDKANCVCHNCGTSKCN